MNVQMFSRSDIMLLGWIHYVAFDLLAGVWICTDATQRDFPHLLLLPVLFFTLMAGPVGLTLYLILRLLFSAKERPAAKTKGA